jgi:SAM-dependent methyltransferase
MTFALRLQPAVAAHAPAPNFDCLARLYRWMEYFSFGPWLERCRCAFITDLKLRRRALVLGGGDGRFTARLLRANSNVQIDAIDISPAMLAALLRRAGSHAGRVRIHCVDLRDWLPAHPPCDLVVSHFSLDCLTTEEFSTLAQKLLPFLAPTALWIVSDFSVPRDWFGRLVARPVIWLLYRAFALLTGLAVRSLPDHHAALRGAGFTLSKRRLFLHGLLFSEIWHQSPRKWQSDQAAIGAHDRAGCKPPDCDSGTVR